MQKNSVETYDCGEFFPYIPRNVGLRNIAINKTLPKKDSDTQTKILGSGSLIKTVILMAFFAILLILFAWTRVQCTTLTYSLMQLNKESRRVDEENKKLKLLRAKLLSPERIERIATRKLDMSYPSENQIVMKK